ncbi:MAG: hypothetical protein K6F98_00795 [Bacteroidales bacterium]|nr:hypothetical protein [Bacteroidales bacterium]
MESRTWKMAVAVPVVTLGDCTANANEMIRLVQEAAAAGARLMLFPELSVTGATCADLFGQEVLVQEAFRALQDMMSRTQDLDIAVAVGLPLAVPGGLADAMVVFAHGRALHVALKQYQPAGKVMQGRRWFVPGSMLPETSVRIGGQSLPVGGPSVFRMDDMSLCLTVGDDVLAPLPPYVQQVASGARAVCVAAAIPALAGRSDALGRHLATESFRLKVPFVYVSAGQGESTTDQVFDGTALLARAGQVTPLSGRFLNRSQWRLCEL